MKILIIFPSYRPKYNTNVGVHYIVFVLHISPLRVNIIVQSREVTVLGTLDYCAKVCTHEALPKAYKTRVCFKELDIFVLYVLFRE